MLTRTERRVLQMVAEGLSNREAAHVLGRSPRTVQHTLERIQSKLLTVDRCTSVLAGLRTGQIR